MLKTPHNNPELTSETINSLNIKARIKVGAESSGDRILNMVMNELKDASIGVIQNLPRKRSFNRIVQKERLVELPDFIPTIPENLKVYGIILKMKHFQELFL